MIQFEVDEKRGDVLDAVRKLARLAGDGKIKIRQVTVVETCDAALIDILGAIIPQKMPVVIEKAQEVIEMMKKGEIKIQPEKPIKKKKGEKKKPVYGVKNCIVCGEEFQPKASRQVICDNASCKVNHRLNQGPVMDLVMSKRAEIGGNGGGNDNNPNGK